MVLSNNSIKNFILVNSFLFILGLYQYIFISYCVEIIKNILIEFLYVFFVFTTRNYFLLIFIDYGTKGKTRINNNNNSLIPKEEYKYEFHINVFTSTAVESITHTFIKTTFINNFIFSRNIYYEIMYFIPFSFIFEIIFDFFHYFTHRLLHNKLLYKYLHKKHHKFKHPSSITTFYQDPIDLLITNSIPTVLSLLFFPYLSYLQFNFIIIYKNFIEISGHSGKKSYPTSSFPQCIWLPKILHIELYTEEHDLHHSLNNCNYGKRFSLWDKVFKTYKSS